MSAWRLMDRASVLSAIANAVIRNHPVGPAVSTSLGAITLMPHQHEAVARVRTALANHGVALLADDVGLGKTFVALAIARAFHHPLVVAPAALRDTWRAAASSAGRMIEFVSHERLSRTSVSELAIDPPDLVIVDEAHHARTTTTARYGALASLACDAPVLLLSATPVHNSDNDLRALFAIAIGERAWSLDGAELSRCIVRRTAADVGESAPHLPEIRFGDALPIRGDDRMLELLLDIPPAVPPSDGGNAPALATIALLRQWASSDAALRDALRRRLGRGEAMRDALLAGRVPSHAELASWTIGDDAVQLAFAELLQPATTETRPLLARLESHLAGVRHALDRLRAYNEADARRAELLRELRRRHDGEKIVAFATYGATVRVLGELLRSTPGIATLSALGGRVAGGRLTRRDLLARFAPRAHGRAPPPAAERIDLLITTDLLSEGVNLQDASVVVHLDVPWTAARLAQRTGRVARIGSVFDTVHAYAIACPASVDAQLRMRERLQEKWRAAECIIGAGDCLPPWVGDTGSLAAAAKPASLRSLLAAWLQPTVPDVSCWCVARGPRHAELAAIQLNGEVRLLASIDDSQFSEDAATVRAAIRIVGSSAATSPLDRGHDSEPLPISVARLERWCEHRLARDAARPLRRGTRARVARVASAGMSGAPAHRKAEAARAATAVTGSLNGRLSANAERQLAARENYLTESTTRPDTSLEAPSHAAPVPIALFIVCPSADG